MPTIREKRVYTDQSETVEAYVAAGLGIAVARVSQDKIGEFSLAERCTARDVAATERGVAAATAEDVLVEGNDGFEGTDFGPAVAVTDYEGDVLAAGEDGRLARYDVRKTSSSAVDRETQGVSRERANAERSQPSRISDSLSDERTKSSRTTHQHAQRAGDGEWTTVGDVSDVRALDADLVASADGVHRVADDGVSAVGLDDARDVAAAGVPLAATPDGLYRLGAGWMHAADGGFEVAASDPVTASAGELGRAHAATADAIYEHAAGEDADAWHARDLPVENSVADVAYATDAVIALTEDGTLAVDAGDGFRHRSLGLRDASALAVAAEGNA